MGDVKYWDGEDFTVLDSKNAKSVNGIKFRINEDILEYSNDGLTWSAQSNFSGSYNDLSDKPTIPINLSQLNNDTGYITDNEIPEVDVSNLMPKSGGMLENYREKLVTVGSGSGIIYLSLGNVFQHTPNGDRTYVISNAINGMAHPFTLIINMGSTVRTLTFPSSVKWQGGEIPDMSTGNKTYVLTFMTVDGGITWLGMFGGEF